MNNAPLDTDFEVRFDGGSAYIEFTLTGDDGETLLASSESASEDTVRTWESQIDAGKPLSLVLTPHTYLGPDTDDGPEDDIVLSGTINACFSANGIEYTVPANDFVDFACRLLSRYSMSEYRVFCMLNRISPKTADIFAEFLVGLDVQASPADHRSGHSRLRPTFLARSEDPLSDEQVVWLFRDRNRTISLRQLEIFLPMMMKNLKPHLQKAGILPDVRINTRNVAVATGRLIDRFIPYIEEHQNEQFLHLLGLLRDHGLLPPYKKPSRP